MRRGSPRADTLSDNSPLHYQNLIEKSLNRWQGFNSTSIFFDSASLLSLARSVLFHAAGLVRRSSVSSSGTGRRINKYFPGARLVITNVPSLFINASA